MYVWRAFLYGDPGDLAVAKIKRKKADEIMLAALVGGATINQTAERVGMCAMTVRRRLADPKFRKRLNDMTREIVRHAAALLTAENGRAIQTLRILQRKGVQHSVRLGAAKAVLELSFRARGENEFEARIKALEERLAEREKQGYPRVTFWPGRVGGDGRRERMPRTAGGDGASAGGPSGPSDGSGNGNGNAPHGPDGGNGSPPPPAATG